MFYVYIERTETCKIDKLCDAAAVQIVVCHKVNIDNSYHKHIQAVNRLD